MGKRPEDLNHGPSMELRFKGEVIYWRGPSPFHFVEIPEKQSVQIKSISKQITYGWGVLPTIAIAKGIEWSTALFPKNGIYLLPLKNVVRDSLKAEVGDSLSVLLRFGPE